MTCHLRTIVLVVYVSLAASGATAGVFAEDRVTPGQAAQLARFEAELRMRPDDLLLGADYRQVVIGAAQYDRALDFLKELTSQHPGAVNAHINLALACADKIPVSSALKQATLGRDATRQLTEALKLKEDWLAYYARGLVYLSYPGSFNRVEDGIADLERALALQRREPKRPRHVRTFIALGDGYWKHDERQRARALWQEGLREFPDEFLLRARMARDDAAVSRLMKRLYKPTRRVDTSLLDMRTVDK